MQARAPPPDRASDGIGEVGAAACGDIMKISLKIKDGKIELYRVKLKVSFKFEDSDKH